MRPEHPDHWPAFWLEATRQTRREQRRDAFVAAMRRIGRIVERGAIAAASAAILFHAIRFLGAQL